jgi:hypothetical protein
MEFEFIKLLEKDLKPLKISVELVSRDHSYYVVLDGSRTFEKTPGTTWHDDYMQFEVFTTMFVKRYFTPVSISNPTLSSTEYEIGNVFDLVKNA